MDLTVEGKVFLNGNFEKCCLGIKDGKISTIKKILKSDNHINFGNKLILPSGIDIHVHFRDPGFTYKEDFSTGSLAAAFGGITCVFDMPNTKPQTTTVTSIKEKIDNLNTKSYVDYGLYAGIINNNISYINELSRYSNGFKIYLGSSTNSLLLDEENLSKTFNEIDKAKKVTLIHAENEKCIEKNKIKENNLLDHLKNRPAICEELSIKNILSSANKTKLKVHICHLSSCEGLEQIKNRSSNISVGVTPNHLFFDIKSLISKPSFLKVNPPIRTKFDREMLNQGLINGFIDIIESDHAPHNFEEKNVDFNDAPSGIPGVETMYPLLLYEVKNGNISFNRLVSAICESPAALFNLPKGKIEVERDADLIVIDLKKSSKIKLENLHSKCDWSPFEERNAIFPSDVFLRGERIIEAGKIQINSGFGNKLNT